MEPHTSSTKTEPPVAGLDPAKDIPLHRSQRYSSRVFAPVKSGNDLLVHREPGGAVCFYLWHWSGDTGRKNTTTPVSEDFAAKYIRDLYGSRETMTGLEPMNLMEYLPYLYWREERKNGKK